MALLSHPEKREEGAISSYYNEMSIIYDSVEPALDGMKECCEQIKTLYQEFNTVHLSISAKITAFDEMILNAELRDLYFLHIKSQDPSWT